MRYHPIFSRRFLGKGRFLIFVTIIYSGLVARSQVAADLCIPNSNDMVISSQTSVEEAMDTLLLSSQNVVALVSENGRVINDLHIDDLLAYAMHESQETINV